MVNPSRKLGEFYIDCTQLCHHTEAIGKTFPRRVLSITVLIDMKDMIDWQDDGAYEFRTYATVEEKARIKREVTRALCWEGSTRERDGGRDGGQKWFIRWLKQRYIWVTGRLRYLWGTEKYTMLWTWALEGLTSY
jgi:hypothetical protein